MTNNERYGRIAQPGDCKPSLQTADHDGWLLLDGRTVNKSDYPRLFLKLGITAASAILPDTRDRFVVGAGGTKKVGDKGGSNSVTLKLENLPPHTHDFNDGSVKAKLSQGNLLTGVLPIMNGLEATTTATKTASAGEGKAVEIPAPPNVAMSYFVYTGKNT